MAERDLIKCSGRPLSYSHQTNIAPHRGPLAPCAFVAGECVDHRFSQDGGSRMTGRRTVVVHTKLSGHMIRVSGARTGDNGLQMGSHAVASARSSHSRRSVWIANAFRAIPAMPSGSLGEIRRLYGSEYYFGGRVDFGGKGGRKRARQSTDRSVRSTHDRRLACRGAGHGYA